MAGTEASQSTTRLAWRWFAASIPKTWEIAAYHLDDHDGQLQLHDRDGLQAQLIWKTVKRAPDLRRLMDDIHRRARETAKLPPQPLTFSTIGVCAVGHGEPGEAAYASAFLPTAKLLLQWYCPRFEPAEFTEVWEPVLRSFALAEGESREWALFNARITLPARFVFTEVLPQPANIRMDFSDPKRVQLRVRRFGMASVLLGSDDEAAFLDRLLRGEHAAIDARESATINGRAGARVRFRRRGTRALDQLTGRWWPGEALLWHDRDTQRLHTIEQWGPRRALRLDLDALARQSHVV